MTDRTLKDTDAERIAALEAQVAAADIVAYAVSDYLENPGPETALAFTVALANYDAARGR